MTPKKITPSFHNARSKMRSKSLSFIAALAMVFSLVFTAGCTPPAAQGNHSFQTLPAAPVYGENGTLGGVSFLLTDFPIQNQNVTAVVVNFRSIEVNSAAGGWQTLIDFGAKGKNYDLLKLQNGVTAELGAFSLEPGTYDQIRLVLNDANYVETTQGTTTVQEPLKIPSGGQTGIKLVQSFEVSAQGYTTLTLDFDAQQSVHYNKGQGFILKPVMKVIGIKTAAGASTLVNAATGGNVSLLGEVAIDIPPQALSRDTAIEIIPVTGPVPSAFSSKTLLSKVYEFLPDATQFNSNVTITYQYDPAEVNALGLDPATLEMVYYDVQQKDWVSIGGTVDTAANTVTAQVNHFTAFGVMGGGKTGITISPAEIRYAGVTLTAVPEKVAAMVTAKKGTVSTVTLYVFKAGQTPNPLVVPMVLNTATGEYEYTLDPAVYYPELSSVTPLFDLQVMIEVTDSAGNIGVAPAKSVTTDPLTWHLYSYDPDRDADGMNDRWEFDNLLNPDPLDPLSADAANDNDLDGLTNLQEYQALGNPNRFDALIGGTVSGLATGETITIDNNGENLVVTGAGTGTDAFQFLNRVADTLAYNVTIVTAPTTKTCTITGGTGTVAAAHVSSVSVSCQAAFSGFTASGSMMYRRDYHDGALLPDGRVLITGGWNGTWSPNSGVVDTAEIYDPATGAFTPTAGRMIEARRSHTATLLNNGKVLIAGGYSANQLLNRAELYDPATGTFSLTGSMTTGRTLHTATLMQDGRVLLAGGQTWSGSMSNTTDIYDPVTGTFTAGPPMSVPRYRHTATLLDSGNVLITGGANGTTKHASIEIYNPLTGTFIVAGNMSTARVMAQATKLPDGMVLISGGYNVTGTDRTAELFDESSYGIYPLPPMTSACWGCTSLLLNNGQVLIAGYGFGTLYDPVNRTFSSAGAMIRVRWALTGYLLQNGQALFVDGGQQGTTELYIP